MSFLKVSLLALGVVILVTGCDKKEENPDIAIGKKYTIHSQVMDEDRSLWIYVPEMNENDTTTKFPVLYLLDGDSHFYSVVGLVHQLSSVNGNDICPKMIVVGIPNTNRSRDLTPTHVTSSGADSSFYKSTGGGEKFTEFIKTEVIPYVEKNHPTSDSRVLVGHSLGGLMVINTMIRHKDLFDKYIAIDPSLWWDDRKALEEYEGALKSIDLEGKGLFIAVANTIAMDTTHALLDTLDETYHFRSIMQFTKTLRKNNSRLDWNFKYYGDEGHSSVPLIAEYDALHYLFRKVPITLDPKILKTFEGVYKHQFTEGVDSFIEITMTDDGLVLHERWSDQKIQFKPLSETDFYSFESQFPLRFIKDNSGNVSEAVAFHKDVWKKVKNE